MLLPPLALAANKHLAAIQPLSLLFSTVGVHQHAVSAQANNGQDRRLSYLIMSVLI